MYRENCLCVGLSLFWYAGRILWSECKNPIRPKIPLDQSYVPTSWVFVTYDSKYFCVFAMWILDLCLCHTSVFGYISVMPPLGLALLWYWLFVCFFFLILCIWSFLCCQVLVFVCYVLCVKLVSAGPIKGRLDFFFFEKKMYDAFTGNDWTMRWNKWMYDAVYEMSGWCVFLCAMRFMDDAFFKKNEWMYDAFYEMNERCV